MIIIGIDPGTTRIGYGLIETSRNFRLLEYGILKIKPVKNSSALIKEAANALAAIIKKYHPDLAGIEKIYFSKNVKTGIAVAQMRGALMLKFAEYNVPTEEFSPSEIKKSITSYGLADKKAVAKMAAAILSVKSLKGFDDASDALAIAITAAMRYTGS